jgi:hypothetical protein
MNNNSNPDRYEVVFTSINDEKHSYTVCTWQNSEKAIAISTGHHLYKKRPPIYSVEVNKLGPAKTKGSGVVDPEPTDLVDRMEW